MLPFYFDHAYYIWLKTLFPSILYLFFIMSKEGGKVLLLCMQVDHHKKRGRLLLLCQRRSYCRFSICPYAM